MSRDIESEVFTLVTDAVMAEYPKLQCSSWPNSAPASFPFAQVTMTGERDVAKTRTSRRANEFRRVTFDVNVYSAAGKTRKSEAKAISRSFASAFRNIGFTETAGGQPLDLTDESTNRTVARYFCRFEATVSETGETFGI